MASKITVTCPHCASTGTYQAGFTVGGPSATGSGGFQCRECRKSFRVHYNRGNIERVTER